MIKIPDHDSIYQYLIDEWEVYTSMVYDNQQLPSDQEKELKQAFFSGIAWLNARRELLEPSALIDAVKSIVFEDPEE